MTWDLAITAGVVGAVAMFAAIGALWVVYDSASRYADRQIQEAKTDLRKYAREQAREVRDDR